MFLALLSVISRKPWLTSRLTGVSKEFETDDGGVISFANLTSNQMRVIDKDNECDYDIL